MKDQGDPVSDNEWILRRVHRDNFITLDPPRISPYAFKPQVTGRFPDTTGISFYRQDCVVDHNDILAKTDEAKREKYGVVRLPVRLLKSLCLDVERDDDIAAPIVLGHVIVPGINSIEYDQDKDAVLPKMKALADYVNEHQEFLRLPSN
jgi:hypothetical protein